MDLQEYATVFDEAEMAFEKAMAKHGLPFEQKESSPRRERRLMAKRCGCRCENGDSSLWHNWISPACLVCRTGEATGSLYVDLRCTKSCYFCFNGNQPHHDYFLSHTRDIVKELEQAYAAGASYDCLAVTGGEPLLHRDQVIAFLKRAFELYPDAHRRLYTNGDLLDDELLSDLAESGLDEMRLSIKPLDSDQGQENAYAVMEKAVIAIPDVVVEVPVLPGSRDEMKSLMRRADQMGARGINLLEFCFPLCNVDEFCKRGFKLRRKPYRFLYDYRYSGGIPVARSEYEALELVNFAVEEGLKMGIHYCSVDNRTSAQINLQNRVFELNPELQRAYPWMDKGDDPFLRTAKALGDDAMIVKHWAELEEIPHDYNEAIPSIVFPRALASQASNACPGTTIAESVNVMEQQDDGSYCMREIGIQPHCYCT